MAHWMTIPALVAALIVVAACEAPQRDTSELDSVRTSADDAKTTAKRALAAGTSAAAHAERAAAAAERAAAAAERAAADTKMANDRADNMFKAQLRK